MIDKPLELTQAIIVPDSPEELSEEDKDIKILAGMLVRATEFHLLVEVVHVFTQEIRAGKSIAEAAHHALYEWDC